MTIEKKRALMYALRIWGAAYAIAAGLLYYKSTVPVSAILGAGVLTLLLTTGRVLLRRETP